ncbi:hypothetical protein [Lelliottia wanjuensis]|uniref:hypothetical protein n=1 Tax=Lelliottia wanjuensis TaxID=3050585 RepID=UPI00254E5E0E|nr:hypothetical protein [Lelliottia sp. V86_10]MDK9585886.1 hypothetical protein [Lelliottia sp. V86_10]
MIKKISLLAVILLAGCSTEASRMADCEHKGISKDVCYQVEQNRSQMYQKQAMENAMQLAQSAHKQKKITLPHTYKGGDMQFRLDNPTQGYLDGKPAAIIETTPDVTTFQQGIFEMVYYKATGKVMLLKNSVLVGMMK